jgi:SAM-dependent methyltransferase
VSNVESAFVERVYQKLAGVYDYTFGPTLHPGRLEAIEKMRIRPGHSVLEVGVGTGINLALYPFTCNITGIDLSSKMLDKARKRIHKKRLAHCQVMEMNAEQMAFLDETFDVVYAPYVISVVPDPVKVAREMFRVCRPGPRGDPEPLQEHKSGAVPHRTGDLAHDRAYRVQGRPRSTRGPHPGQPRSRVHREGQRPEDVDARHLHKALRGIRNQELVSCNSGS